MISVVIPIHNEEPAILPLYDRLTRVMEAIQKPYEIIFIDDASTDRSFELLANLVETDGRLKVIRLRRNFGQTAALAAGSTKLRAMSSFRSMAICSTIPRTFRRCSPKSKKATTLRAGGERTGSITRSRARYLPALRTG